jgi:superfamily I DNA and/or RNA helicase/serine/threonine protein kinase
MATITNIPAEPVVGRYRLIRRVGGGNMSTVYEAEDSRRGKRIVAVKLLNTEHNDELKQEIFRRETRALSQLEHPNIVTVLDNGWDAGLGCHYLVFDYIPRTLLDEITAQARSRDNDWCWPLMREMADALVHAHSQGIIHRDVKPSNVLISSDGHPMLVDFGVSYLKYELNSGVTVSSFWSVGYASPEQRQGQPVREQSDIYSLGCVFYHMLKRQSPPTDGLTSALVDALAIPTQIKTLLKRMTALEPSARFAQTTQMRRQLEVTKTFQLLPDVYLLVTDSARRDLFDLGHLTQSSSAEACAFLLEELGGDNPKDVRISLEHGDIRIFTDTMRLVCTRDSRSPVLVIKAVHQPYLPQLEQQKAKAISVRYLWQAIEQIAPGKPPTVQQRILTETLDTLQKQLLDHQSNVAAERKRTIERKDLTRTWESVVVHQLRQLDAFPKLSYESVVRDGDILVIRLTEPAPDDLSWPENAPVGIFDPHRPQNGAFIGYAARINGNSLEVSRGTSDTPRPFQTTEQLPGFGLIGLYQQEARAALERQRDALGIVRSGSAVNPDLPDILLDLSNAKFDDLDLSLEFVQRNLAEDKQQAVRQALAARDLFVLQGPPGTGKTTTLAEIIVQILKVKPESRILVSSQSNVAVNHILTRVAELQGSASVEIVRIGRAEKIGQGAELWTIEQRLASWRAQVLAHTDIVLTDLKKQVQQLRRAQKTKEHLSPHLLDEIQQCQEWLVDLEGQLEDIIDLNESERGEKNADIEETLALIRATLPEAESSEVAPTLAAECQRLARIISSLLDPASADRPEERLLTLVERWRKIFGKRIEDFGRPILERANILAATCLITGGRYLKNEEFDWAIIDEAGRATVPEIMVPLVRARKAIIVGDERQLPPMLDAELSNENLDYLGTSKEDLEMSLFASLVEQGKEQNPAVVQMLTVQHRMHPAIGQLVSEVFYNGQLSHGVDPSEREHGLSWLSRAVVWYSTARIPKHGETGRGQSFYNRTEIVGISKLLHRMEYSYREKGEHRDVAVITPYNAQIVELMAEIMPGSQFWQSLSIEISTIDAFQGRDRDIVLYSTVRSNPQGTLGFLRDRRRLNVALSRARQALLIVGDLPSLERGRTGPDGNPYQELGRYLRTHMDDCLIDDLDVETPHG